MAGIHDLQKRLQAEIEQQKKQPKPKVIGTDGHGRQITIKHAGTEYVRLDARVDEGEVEGEYEGDEEEWYY